jgi:hypothetical protein
MNAKPHAQKVTPQMQVSDNAFDEDVDRLSRPRESGFEHHEAHLHTEDEERGDQRPRRVEGVHFRCRLRSGPLRKGWRRQIDPHHAEQEREANNFATSEREHLHSHLRVSKRRGEASP